MALADILNLASSHEEEVKDDISEERLMSLLRPLTKQIAFYRAYPDIFIDDLTGFSQWDEKKDGPWKGFKFFYYQRVTLRALMRHRKVYVVFSRGFSKSFLSVLSLMVKAVLYPGSELFITTGGKIIII